MKRKPFSSAKRWRKSLYPKPVGTSACPPLPARPFCAGCTSGTARSPVLNRVLVGYDGDASEIVVPDGVERVMTMFSNYNAYEAALITSIVFPDSVTEIGELTLHGCHSLTTLTFGDGPAHRSRN